MEDKVLAEKGSKKKSGSSSQKGTRGKSKSKDVLASDDLIIASLKDEVTRKLAGGKSKGEKSAAKTSKLSGGLKIAGGKSKDVAVNDDLIISALKDEAIRKLAGGKPKGKKSVAKGSKSAGGLKIAGGKLKDVVVNDNLIIAAFKDEAVRKLAGRKSNREKSAAEKSKSGGGFKIIKGAQGAETDSLKEVDKENIKAPMKRKRGADREIQLVFLSSPERNLSRLRPRKDMPTFRMVELGENDDDRIIGKRVKVYWSGSRKWFTGRIKTFDNKKRLHEVLYEDGDKEELELRKERFELEIMPTEGFKLRTEVNSREEVKNLDSSQVNTETLLEDSVMVGDAETVTKSSEQKKKKTSRKAARRGNSRSKKKKDAKANKAEDLVAKMDVDVLPEDFDKVITDEVHDSEEAGNASSKEGHAEHKSILEITKKDNETLEEQVTGPESNSEVKEMELDDSEESSKTVKDDSIKVGDALPAKWRVSSKKKPVSRAEKRKSSTSNSWGNGTKLENMNANTEVDVLHDEVKTSATCGDINIEEFMEVNYLKNNKKTEALAKESSESNGEMSDEAQASKTDFNAENKEIGFDVAKVSCLEDNMEDLAADVEVTTRPENVKEEMISGEINVEGPGEANTVKSNDEIDSLSKATSERACEVSIDLHPTILTNIEEENPEILQGELNIENGESEEYITKEEVEKNSLSEEVMRTSSQDLQRLDDNQSEVDLAREITVEARKDECSNNSDSLKNPVRRDSQ